MAQLCKFIFLGLVLIFSVTVFAAEKKAASADSSCLETLLGEELSGLDGVDIPKVKGVFDQIAIQSEVRKPSELFAAGAGNLIKQRPFIIMNSAQRLLAMIYSQGRPERIYLPGSSHKQVYYYPVMSDGPEVTDGTRVVGQYEGISDVVAGIHAQALGDRSGNSPTLMVGPHGTGKSEFLKIIRSLYLNISSRVDSPYSSYTYRFKDLHKIPALRGYLEIMRNDAGEEYTNTRSSPVNDSPYVLFSFSPELQGKLKSYGYDKVVDMLGGMDPRPMNAPDPQSEKIRDEILKYYRSLNGGKDLDNKEILAVLDRHVEIVRVQYGKGHGTLPTIEFQGNDIDSRGLFIDKDPTIAITNGPGDVMAWHLNGKVLSGNGNAILFDEVMRNSDTFLNFLLAIFESRIIDVGGMPRVPFDSVIIAATNKANVDKAKQSAEKNAAIDRFNPTKMPYAVRPHEVADTLLYMKEVGLVAQALGGEASSDEEEDGAETTNQSREQDQAVTVRDLFPLPKGDGEVLGPDGRYRLWYQEGVTRLAISPHTLLFMCEIVAATRIVTSTSGFDEILKPFKVTGSTVFRDEIARVLYNEGRGNLNSSEAQELSEVLGMIGEGNTGISNRDAGRWLSRVIREASAPEGLSVITPDLALRVFKEMLGEGAISSPSIAETARWFDLAQRVSTEILAKRLDRDVYTAMASNNSNVETAYGEVLEELKALHADPEAKEVTTGAGGRSKPIDFERMRAIQSTFLARTGRPLVAGDILVSTHKISGGASRFDRHEGLYSAVTEYYAELETKRYSVDDLLRFASDGDGSEDVKSAYNQFLQGMSRLGYEEYGALMALDFAKRLRNETTNR